MVCTEPFELLFVGEVTESLENEVALPTQGSDQIGNETLKWRGARIDTPRMVISGDTEPSITGGCAAYMGMFLYTTSTLFFSPS